MNCLQSKSLAPATLILLALLSGCSTVPSSTSDKDVSYAVKDLGGTPLGEMAVALTAGRTPDQSGFLLLDRGKDALAWRLFMADHATKTIDAQYFLWKNDRIGRLFIQHLLDAAERGVHVRVLIDDSMTESDPIYLARFGAHPNVEVRLYKPFGPAHKSFIFRWIDFAADFKLMNRRMHNKLYIADDSVMITGGRNIGDDYFEYLAPDVFRDRDLMGVGQIADAGSDAFDMFWNSVWTVPIEMIVDPPVTTQEAESFIQTLDQAGEDPANYPPAYAEVGSIETAQARLETALMWGEWRLVYDTVPGDDGEPLVPKEATNTVGDTLHELAMQATQDVIIESAYLILTDSTLDRLKEQLARGIEVYALTNSLAANNHTTAFVAYRKQRKDMARHFTGLYEYRPDAKNQTELYNELAPGEDVPHLGLHAKTAVFDRKAVFVGSFNLDPRSENLNTEIGILVKSDELANAVADSILGDASPGNAWLIRLDDRGRTQWVTVEADGTEKIESNDEPLSSSGRMIEADLAQPFTPESQM